MADATDPNLAAVQPKSNGRALTLKDLAILLGMMMTVVTAAGFILGLMFFPKVDGQALRKDHEHHVETAAPKLEKIETLEKNDIKLDKTLYRIEVRQMMRTPKHRRKDMPDLPPVPESD